MEGNSSVERRKTSAARTGHRLEKYLGKKLGNRGHGYLKSG
jgi:hypothetical protein